MKLPNTPQELTHWCLSVTTDAYKYQPEVVITWLTNYGDDFKEYLSYDVDELFVSVHLAGKTICQGFMPNRSYRSSKILKTIREILE